MADRLTELGLRVDLEGEIRAAERDTSRTIGRPHVADALVRAGYCIDRTDAFDKYIGEGGPAFIQRRGATPEDVIELIAASGGLASLAHPALLGRDEIIPMLVAAGLPAIEVFHSDHDEFDRQRYRRAAEKSNLLCTGGSDYHGEQAGRPVVLGAVTLPAGDFERFRDRLFA
jgi:predicted metal-dependent phosphoesterase TrpH